MVRTWSDPSSLTCSERISCWPDRPDHGQRGTKHTCLSCKDLFAGTKKCLWVGAVFQHFHMGGSAPWGEAQTHQEHQSGAITALAAQDAQPRSVFHTHSHYPGGTGLCPFSLGPISHSNTAHWWETTLISAQSTPNLPLVSFHLFIQLWFFSFSLLDNYNLFNQTCSCSSPFSAGFSATAHFSALRREK